MSPFDFVNSITFTKDNLFLDGNAKDYNAYMVNTALSYFPDTIFHALAMDRLSHLDTDMQYEYYLKAVPKKKRFSKWGKAVNVEEIEAIKVIYDYSHVRAMEVLNTLSPEQIKEIVTLYTKGYGGTSKAK